MTGLNGIVTRDETSVVSWHADAPVVLGPVRFEVDGIWISVDGAFPGTVIDVVAERDQLVTYPKLFNDPTFADRLAASRDDDRIIGPELAPPILRLATVHSVDQLYLGEIDDAALLLDYAYAYQVAELYDRAARHYTLGALAAERLVDEIAEGGHTLAAARRLRAVIDASPDTIIDSATRTHLLKTLDARLRSADIDWNTGISKLIEHGQPATTLGGRSAVTGQLNDLGAFLPRTLRFTKPEVPDLEITSTQNGVWLRGPLREDVIPDTIEIQETLAVAADASTGVILAVAPCTVSDEMISAELYPGTNDPTTLRFAFISADTPLEALRLDWLGVGITLIDRYCRYAWSLYRESGALLAGASLTEHETESAWRQARAHTTRTKTIAAARVAVGQLRILRGRTDDTDEDEALARYSDAVAAFSRVPQAAPETGGPSGPTLTELLATGMS